jgi:hypothetical protein
LMDQTNWGGYLIDILQFQGGICLFRNCKGVFDEFWNCRGVFGISLYILVYLEMDQQQQPATILKALRKGKVCYPSDFYFGYMSCCLAFYILYFCVYLALFFPSVLLVSPTHLVTCLPFLFFLFFKIKYFDECSYGLLSYDLSWRSGQC